MFFNECKRDMRVLCDHGRYLGKKGTIISVNPVHREITVKWDDCAEKVLDITIAYLRPLDEPVPPTLRAASLKQVSDEDKLYQFFAVCTSPGCCPKCSAPQPCKYHT